MVSWVANVTGRQDGSPSVISTPFSGTVSQGSRATTTFINRQWIIPSKNQFCSVEICREEQERKPEVSAAWHEALPYLVSPMTQSYYLYARRISLAQPFFLLRLIILKKQKKTPHCSSACVCVSFRWEKRCAAIIWHSCVCFHPEIWQLHFEFDVFISSFCLFHHAAVGKVEAWW